MNRILIIGFILTLWSCANRVAPTGGPKDEQPPQLVKSVPEYGQRNYLNQSIELEFDEFISLKSLKEQLIITPRIESDYEFKYRKRSVYLEFEEPFDDSTTYTLNFRDGIVDITENQPALDLQIAFSTGNLLDTLEIYGSVLDLLTQQPIKDATVGLYAIDDTLDIFTGPPYYFAKTDETGHYHFRNIKDGQYRIYAFNDSNKNLTCESANETYGFLSEPIVLDSIAFADTLYTEIMNIDTLQLLRVRPSGRYFNVLANKYLTDVELTASNDSSLVYHFNEDHDGLVVYNTFAIKDSLKVFTTLKDSLNQVAKDSFYLQFPETSRRPSEFKTSIRKVTSTNFSKTLVGEMTFTKPLKEIQLDSIHIFKDTLTSYFIQDNFEFLIDTLENKLEFAINTPKEILDTLKYYRDDQQREGPRMRVPNYYLILPEGSMYSIEGDTSEQIRQSISLIDPAERGIITGKIETNHSSYFIQLLSNKYEVVAEQEAGKTYEFRNIEPGEYFIRILIDTNNNGLWDHSDIRFNRPAEPLIIYRDASGNNKTAVRANWEINVDLKF